MNKTFAELIGHAVDPVEIVDIGAMSEGTECYAGLLASGEARLTGFEPNPEQFAQLKDKPGPCRYLPYFLGTGGKARFHLTNYDGCSSLIEPDPSVIDLFDTIGAGHSGGNFYVKDTAEVETVRLDDLGPDVIADYLKIDVQGAELDVLKNGTEKLKDTIIIQSEVEFLPLYRNQPLFGDMQVFLRDHGFVFHKFIDIVGRTFKPVMQPDRFQPYSQMLWADAIFVRDFTRLGRWSDAQLLKGALVLDLALQSYDLVPLLLAEFDRRRGTATRPAYVANLAGRSLKPLFMNIKPAV
jgi:FkbM family methyltransferase